MSIFILSDIVLANCDFFESVLDHYSYPAALELVASGKVNVKQLVTHRFSLQDSRQAFTASGAGDNGAIKVMISCAAGE